MKKNISVLSIAYFTFILLTLLSESLVGISSDVMYYLSFVLPFFAVILFTDREIPKMGEFSFSAEAKKLLFPTVFPTVLAIALISLLSSALISLFGGTPASTDLGEGLIYALFRYAFLPSILEEMLFRYLPMRYIAPYSGRCAVLFSAVFFSLAHHSFFSIPYALFAGAVFMTVNLLCRSSLPSIILHFVNNAVSVVWMMYFAEKFGGYILLGVLALPTVLSLAVIFNRRRLYLSRLSDAFSDRGKGIAVTPVIFAAVISVLAAAVAELAM